MPVLTFRRKKNHLKCMIKFGKNQNLQILYNYLQSNEENEVY